MFHNEDELSIVNLFPEFFVATEGKIFFANTVKENCFDEISLSLQKIGFKFHFKLFELNALNSPKFE